MWPKSSMATPQLYYKPGGIAELIMHKCPELKMPFSPSIWAPDPHTQSAMGSECVLLPRLPCHDAAPAHACHTVAVLPPVAVLRILTARGSYTRQLVMTSDHGTLGLDWWCGSDKATWAAPDAPIVLFIHGINGEQQQQQRQCLPGHAARQLQEGCRGYCTDRSAAPTSHLTCVLRRLSAVQAAATRATSSGRVWLRPTGGGARWCSTCAAATGCP